MLRWSNKQNNSSDCEQIDLIPVEVSMIDEFDKDPPEDREIEELDDFILNTPCHKLLIDEGYNLLLSGDNKTLMRHLLNNNFSNSVDLIYIDPPFMTNTNFYKQISVKSVAANYPDKNMRQMQYNDKWELADYLQFMYDRLILMKSLLKRTGSIYVHLDENCVHYIKVLMDEVFGVENFRRDITWNTASLNVAGFKGIIRDNWIYGSGHILFYTKSEDYTFNTQFNPRDKDFIERKYVHEDEGGRYRITRRDNKIYLKDDHGEPMTNIWNDILSFNYAKIACNESVFYPTQKPENLLKRIIKASSNSGDLVLDCFAGSGTTMAAAQSLGRRWIGIDANPVSIQTISKRIQRMLVNQPTAKKQFILFQRKDSVSGNAVKNNALNFEIERDEDTDKLILLLKSVDNQEILSAQDKIKKISYKDKKKMKISATERKKVTRKIEPNQIDMKALLDSYYIEIIKCRDQEHRPKPSIFHSMDIECPKKKHAPVSMKKQYKFSNDKQPIQFRIKTHDIFGNTFFAWQYI